MESFGVTFSNHCINYVNFWKTKVGLSKNAEHHGNGCVSFGYRGPQFLTFKTDRLDLRGLDPGKSDVKGSLA